MKNGEDLDSIGETLVEDSVVALNEFPHVWIVHLRHQPA